MSNLPVKISSSNSGEIPYIYDASGIKFSKKVNDNGTITTTTYLGDFHYTDEVLDFFPHPSTPLRASAEGYVKVTEDSNNAHFNYVFNYTDHPSAPLRTSLGNIRVRYAKNPDTGATEILEENHYYPFGLKHQGYNSNNFVFMLLDLRETITLVPLLPGERDGYKYKFGGKEFQDELGLDWYDYGARMYMPDIARWGATDNKAELYFATSPYVYALNQPTNAIDPDGNLVIFINGNHYGDGSSGYKRPKDSDYGIYGKPRDYNFYGTSSYWGGFDKRVQTQLNDHARAVYRDGSMGGRAPLCTSCLKASSRDKAGFEQGKIDAKTIIKNLERDPQGNIVESIKIITHSMGGAYGKGYVRALKEYISSLPYEMQKQIKITLVADFDPFQGGRLTADSDIFTQQFTHIGGLADQRQKGLDDDNYYEDDEEKSHAIMSFLSDISNLEEGVYEWNNQTKKMECVTCKKDK